MDQLEHIDETDMATMIDLTLPENGDIADDIVKNKGELGRFVGILLERAKKEKKSLMLAGRGTTTISIKYDDAGVQFYLRPSVDSGADGVTHAHYALRTHFYKKPWVREIIAQIPDNGWLEIVPVTFAEISSSLGGEQFDLGVIEAKYPNVQYEKLINIIRAETHDLDQYFTHKPAPGLEFFKMIFKDDAMKEAYINEDQAKLQPIKDAITGALQRIHTALKAANEKA